jgi:hypothetical protein
MEHVGTHGHRHGRLSWVVGPWFGGDERVAGPGDGTPVHHPR